MSTTIYTADHKYVVAQLKKARKEAGLDQVEVARLLKKTQSFVSKVECGQRRVDIVELKAFAKLYKKHISCFVPD